MKRLESRYRIALNKWISVFRILTPICSDPEYTSSKKFWAKKTPNRQRRFIFSLALAVVGIIGIITLSVAISMSINSHKTG